jgi:hypothetical protein
VRANNDKNTCTNAPATLCTIGGVCLRGTALALTTNADANRDLADTDQRSRKSVTPSGSGTLPAVEEHIPPDHLPSPGECRIWFPGRPSGYQSSRAPLSRVGGSRTRGRDTARQFHRLVPVVELEQSADCNGDGAAARWPAHSHLSRNRRDRRHLTGVRPRHRRQARNERSNYFGARIIRHESRAGENRGAKTDFVQNPELKSIKGAGHEVGDFFLCPDVSVVMRAWSCCGPELKHCSSCIA